MRDRELISALKTAYASQESDSERAFIRQYGSRSLQLPSILQIEFKYMGVLSCLTGLLLFIFLYAGVRTGNDTLMWTVSSFLPLGSVIPLVAMRRSERYGMSELETASRFSLHFVRLVRMMLLGAFSLFVLIVGSIFLKGYFSVSLEEIVFFITIPYFLSVWGGLFVTRKWHSSNNVFGVLAVSLLACFLPILFRDAVLTATVSGGFVFALCAAVAFVTVRECICYIRESENPLWNLC